MKSSQCQGSVSSCVQLFVTEWIVTCQALCPWTFPSKNTGVGYHFLIQGIFPAQGLNLSLLRLLHWQADYLSLSGMPSNQLTLWKQIQNLLQGISQVFSLKVSEKKLCMCVCLIPGSPTLQAYSLPSELPGKPK